MDSNPKFLKYHLQRLMEDHCKASQHDIMPHLVVARKPFNNNIKPYAQVYNFFNNCFENVLLYATEGQKSLLLPRHSEIILRIRMSLAL